MEEHVHLFHYNYVQYIKNHNVKVQLEQMGFAYYKMINVLN